MSFRGEKEIQAQALKQCEDFKVMLQESRSTIADLRRDLRTRELEAEQLPTLKVGDISISMTCIYVCI